MEKIVAGESLPDRLSNIDPDGPMICLPLPQSPPLVVSLCQLSDCKLFGAGTSPTLCSLYGAMCTDGAIFSITIIILGTVYT